MQNGTKNNIYILADVYDVVHNNTYTGSNLWQGDSLQIAFDTFMNGLAPGTTKGYQSDDYEFGIGLTPNGIENYQYVASDSPIGNIEEHLSAVIRNDKLGITRYLIKIPNTYTKQPALKAGNKFGFNIAVNDSDVLLREGYSQYTSGICDSKKIRRCSKRSRLLQTILPKSVKPTRLHFTRKWKNSDRAVTN
ncbi:MAG: hypothetical protein L6V93_22765 [Clostridiales bacterium]|nr:MAG: hypothetical protein L6V93_22765 [Clostridiales bacterium]